MSMQSEGKDAKGRNYDRVTKDGSSSAGSMGAGGTGDIGRMAGEAGAVHAGNAQSGSRTDDWLSSGTEQESRQGFRPSDPGALETGLEGMARSGSQHNDWGRSQAGSRGKEQSGNEQSGGVAGTGGVGHRHRDWGHSDVGNAQSGAGASRQGVTPGEEAGELQTGLGGIESLSTGNAGSRQSEEDTGPEAGKTGRR